uniref:Uncharacterized protein n=1 Tax=Anopheles maculatus TaxID=74869 RepID=A0A182T1M2_9DIPT
MSETPEKELSALELGDLYVSLPLNMAESCDPDNEAQSAAVGENRVGEVPFDTGIGDALIGEVKPDSCDDEAAPWNPTWDVATAEDDEQAVEYSDDENVEKEADHTGESCDPDNEEQAAALGE